MKSLYWNIRGIANSPSRLALKRLILLHKPDFIFLAEPWMNFNHFPASWLHRLGFKLFSFNNRDHLLPNLWCICSLHLDPILIDYDSQQVTFTINLNNNTLFFSSIYASTSNIKRKDLWHKLSSLQSRYDAPWCLIGDFNIVLGSHEHCGSFSPARPPMIDFQSWTDINNLIHLPTRGAFFTWDNGRMGRRHTKRRLDRSICNKKNGWIFALSLVVLLSPTPARIITLFF